MKMEPWPKAVVFLENRVKRPLSIVIVGSEVMGVPKMLHLWPLLHLQVVRLHLMSQKPCPKLLHEDHWDFLDMLVCFGVTAAITLVVPHTIVISCSIGCCICRWSCLI